MDDEFRKRLIDYFEGFELVELLGISIEEVIEAFEDKIAANYNELAGYVNYGR